MSFIAREVILLWTATKKTTTAGDFNQAVAVEYRLDATEQFGICPTPVKAYSMTDQVQGLAVNDGKIYLSTSWGGVVFFQNLRV